MSGTHYRLPGLHRSPAHSTHVHYFQGSVCTVPLPPCRNTSEWQLSTERRHPFCDFQMRLARRTRGNSPITLTALALTRSL